MPVKNEWFCNLCVNDILAISFNVARYNVLQSQQYSCLNNETAKQKVVALFCGVTIGSILRVVAKVSPV